MTTSCPAAAETARRIGFRLVAPALLGAAISMASAPALANDPAAAEALFQVAKGLMDKKNYAEACPKFEASYNLDPAIGTKLNHADCLEKQGKLARAWVAWGDAREQGKRENDTPRAELAARRQKELDPRVPRLTVDVKGSVEGLWVYRDEVKLDPASFGVPLPVDPGKHAVTLRRGKDVLKETSVESKEMGKDQVTLDATDVPPPTPEQLVRTQPQTQVTPVGPEKPKYRIARVRRSTGMMIGGIALTGVGSIVAIVGGVMLGADEIKGAVTGDKENSGGLGTLVVGGVMMGGGIALAIIGGQKIERKLEVTYAPELFIGPRSVMVRGHF